MALAPTGAHAPTGDTPPLDLHALYQQQSACGYTYSLTLPPHSAAGIAARLRGINAAACVLIAANDGELLDIGAFIRAGLAEAINALADDAASILEHHNERAAAAAH